MKRLFVAALVAVSLLGLGACKSADPYAAKVNGVTISKKALDAELNAIRNNKEYREAIEQETPVSGQGQGTIDSSFVARVLTRRIYLELVHQEVLKRKIKLSPADLRNAKQQLLSSIGDEQMLEKFPDSYVEEITRTSAEVAALQSALADASDANLRRYYRENVAQFETVCAAHILVTTKAEADAVTRQLKAATDKPAKFAELAKAQSKDPGSGANGGDLGCVAPSGYVEQFKDAVRTQKVGEIGSAVQTEFGYHIIRVDRRDPAKPFEEVEEQVRQAITDNQQGPFTEFLTKATANAEIEINPRYGTFDKTGGSPQVVPPKPPANNSSSD